MVLIKDNLPRGSWKISKIIALNEGNDGQIRSAKIMLPNGKATIRAINHLYPLETSFTDDSSGRTHRNSQREDDPTDAGEDPQESGIL